LERCLYYITIPAKQTVTVSVVDYVMDCPYDNLQILVGTNININLCSSAQRQINFSGGPSGFCTLNLIRVLHLKIMSLFFHRRNNFIFLLQWAICNSKRIQSLDLSNFNCSISHNSCTNFTTYNIILW